MPSAAPSLTKSEIPKWCSCYERYLVPNATPPSPRLGRVVISLRLLIGTQAALPSSASGNGLSKAASRIYVTAVCLCSKPQCRS